MEKKRLLQTEEEEGVEVETHVQRHEYGSSSSSEESATTEEPVPQCIANVPWMVKIYRQRSHIPGYGMWRLFREASAYALYVLFIMLLVYLLNQLDRYTFSITAKYVGFELQFGEPRCLPNFTELLSPEYNIPRGDVYGSIMADCRNSTRVLVAHVTYLPTSVPLDKKN